MYCYVSLWIDSLVVRNGLEIYLPACCALRFESQTFCAVVWHSSSFSSRPPKEENGSFSFFGNSLPCQSFVLMINISECRQNWPKKIAPKICRRFKRRGGLLLIIEMLFTKNSSSKISTRFINIHKVKVLIPYCHVSRIRLLDSCLEWP